MGSNLKILTRSLPERTTPAPSFALVTPTSTVLCVTQINLGATLVIWVRWEGVVEPAIVNSNVYKLL